MVVAAVCCTRSIRISSSIAHLSVFVFALSPDHGTAGMTSTVTGAATRAGFARRLLQSKEGDLVIIIAVVLIIVKRMFVSIGLNNAFYCPLAMLVL